MTDAFECNNQTHTFPLVCLLVALMCSSLCCHSMNWILQNNLNLSIPLSVHCWSLLLQPTNQYEHIHLTSYILLPLVFASQSQAPKTAVGAAAYLPPHAGCADRQQCSKRRNKLPSRLWGCSILQAIQQ